MEIGDSNKRLREDIPLFIGKKQKIIRRIRACYLRSLGSPLRISSDNSIRPYICLIPDRVYTFGRNKCCDFIFDDRRISKRHCQIFVDGCEGKIYVIDGFVAATSYNLKEILHESGSQGRWEAKRETLRIKASQNGVFINGRRIQKGFLKGASVGDEISLTHGFMVGFVVEQVDFYERIGQTNSAKMARNDVRDEKAPVQLGHDTGMLVLKTDRTNEELKNADTTARALFLLSRIRRILRSKDPVSCILRCLNMDGEKRILVGKGLPLSSKMVQLWDSVHGVIYSKRGQSFSDAQGDFQNPVNEFMGARSANPSKIFIHRNEAAVNCLKSNPAAKEDGNSNLGPDSIHTIYAFADPSQKNHIVNKEAIRSECFLHKRINCIGAFNQHVSCPGEKKLLLNRLDLVDRESDHCTVSLPELMHPLNTVTGIFIATFTSDIPWFLSYCNVPNLMPVTVACHSRERCWNADSDKRTFTPYSDYPNLSIVYPLFPDVIAFSKDRKKQGVACHHPKLLLLQRKSSIRVIITSANLVSRQWNNVTNTVWWQDFPHQIVPDYLSLFPLYGESSEPSKYCDFAAQLAGFVASLLDDVPCQTHWVTDLALYDFEAASVHLVASVPGIHMLHVPRPSSTEHFLSVKQINCPATGYTKFLGSVQAFVVGLSHRFHLSGDPNGLQLKILATLLSSCHENVHGLSEVILKRISDIPADPNAVGIFVCGLGACSERDSIQLGFLSKAAAKWIAPLCDTGIFSFSAFIYPKEALAAALGRLNTKVQLTLYVSQGPMFSEISKIIQSECSFAVCSLISLLQRSVGLWRLQEVLGQYKWPESQESDFIYGSSSIGTAVNASFIAAFSAAAGKRSSQFSDSEESDPEWGRWNVSCEQRHPSVRILFPTIERVKRGASGIEAFRHLLCLSERTWQRLKVMDNFYDAIPQSSSRSGFPMHVKVARRRFRTGNSSPSFGWVYCGSHNFSAAAWGHPITIPSHYGSDLRLHICNYELGILFVVPPPDKSETGTNCLNLDDITLPFVVPAPKYSPNDRPATIQSMKEAAEIAQYPTEGTDLMDVDIPDEEEGLEITDSILEEGEEEKKYAENLWSQRFTQYMIRMKESVFLVETLLVVRKCYASWDTS